MKSVPLFEFLQEVSRRPGPFSEYTARDLWDDPHTAERMLAYHLDPIVDFSSRNHDFISRSAEWIGCSGRGTRTLNPARISSSPPLCE